MINFNLKKSSAKNPLDQNIHKPFLSITTPFILTRDQDLDFFQPLPKNHSNSYFDLDTISINSRNHILLVSYL